MDRINQAASRAVSRRRGTNQRRQQIITDVLFHTCCRIHIREKIFANAATNLVAETRVSKSRDRHSIVRSLSQSIKSFNRPS